MAEAIARLSLMTVPGHHAPAYEINPGGTYQGRLLAATPGDDSAGLNADAKAQAPGDSQSFSSRVHYPEITYALLPDRLGPAKLQPRPRGLVDAVHQPPAPVSTANELRLSITTPAGVRPGDDLPVVVFIHGGGYEWGARDEPWFDGAGFARDNIITVSVSYRLGVDGFLPFHDDIPYHYRGIDDCNTALDWIQKNIEDFGGDPTNVTLMGQSAGAGICLWLARRDHYRGTFRRVWAMSPGFPRTPLARRKWLLRAIAGPVTRKNFHSLGVAGRAAAFKKFRRFVATDLPLGPYPYSPDELADVDLVITCTGQEFHRHGVARKLDASAISWLLRPVFAAHLGARIGYRAATPKFFGQLITDSLFTQLVATTAEARPNTWVVLYEGTDERPALHCCDLPLIFGNYELIKNTPWDLLHEPSPALLEKCHRRAVDFARAATPAWPAYGRERQVLSVDINSGEQALRTDPFARTRRYFTHVTSR